MKSFIKYFSPLLVIASLTGCAAIDKHGIGYSPVIQPVYDNASGNKRFINPENVIGCAEVVSVRNVNQSPIYDARHERKHGSTSNAFGATSAASQMGIIGMGTAIAGAIIADTVIDANRVDRAGLKTVNIPPNNGQVKAVKLRMDDGRELNLPLADDPDFSFSGKFEGVYKIGDRYSVLYSSTFDNVQLSQIKRKDDAGIKPETHIKMNEVFCTRRLDKEKSDAVLLRFSNAVDESKIY